MGYRGERKWKDRGTEGQQSAVICHGSPAPQSLGEPPIDSSPRYHSWPQTDDLSSSTVRPCHYRALAFAFNGRFTMQQPCCNPTLWENNNLKKKKTNQKQPQNPKMLVVRLLERIKVVLLCFFFKQKIKAGFRRKIWDGRLWLTL